MLIARRAFRAKVEKKAVISSLTLLRIQCASVNINSIFVIINLKKKFPLNKKETFNESINLPTI